MKRNVFLTIVGLLAVFFTAGWFFTGKPYLARLLYPSTGLSALFIFLLLHRVNPKAIVKSSIVLSVFLLASLLFGLWVVDSVRGDGRFLLSGVTGIAVWVAVMGISYKPLVWIASQLPGIASQLPGIAKNQADMAVQAAGAAKGAFATDRMLKVGIGISVLGLLGVFTTVFFDTSVQVGQTDLRVNNLSLIEHKRDLQLLSVIVLCLGVVTSVVGYFSRMNQR